MKVVIAGGTGTLGRRVADDLAGRGDDVVVLTRSPRVDLPHRQVQWDGETVGPWAAELDGAAVVNLAGELVDRRPTSANIALLTRSRVQPTRALAEAAATVSTPPPVWLQSSTLAIYGDAGETVLVEGAPVADGPPQMAGVARAWEAAAADVPAHRQVIWRTSLVLDRDTPVMDRLAQLARWGLGGSVAGGRQWVSWIHVEDFLAVVRLSLDDDAMDGMFHVTSPSPVRNAELMAELRAVLGRRRGLPSPALAVKLGAVALRTDPALALTGRRGVPQRLLDLGFAFNHPELGPALNQLLR